MLHNLNALMAPALMERLTLVVNHVLAAEPVATERLRVHVDKLMRVELGGWPALLPAPPQLAFRVTAAGLVEWCPDDLPADLMVRLDGSNPAALALRMLSGEPPPVTIAGDAALAAEVDWLLKNLRWDVESDLERLFGPLPARELHRLGSWLARGLRQGFKGAASAAQRLRPSSS